MPDMCYIGRTTKQTAQHAPQTVVTAVVDCPDMARDLPATIAKWMRDGLTIERVPVWWVRKYLGTTEMYAAEKSDANP